MTSTTYEQHVPALWILSLYRLSSEPNLRSITSPERWTGYHGLADLVSRYAQCHIGASPTNAHPHLGQEPFLAATRQRAAKYRANQGVEQDTGQRRERLFAGYQRQPVSEVAKVSKAIATYHVADLLEKG